MNQVHTTNQRREIAGYLVGIGFLITAAGFMVLSPKAEIPIAEQSVVATNQISPAPWRVALADPPMIINGAIQQRCNDCHALFENTRDPARELNQHTEIRLHHGSNDGCLNCHDKGDREKLTLRGGGLVGYDHVEQLCAQCHGPIFRDWEKGTHGKTLGYWNTDLGEAIKLTCTQCHDPHSPSFKPIEPLRGPNTLRMGKQRPKHQDEMINAKNPLQRWRLLENTGSEKSEHGSGHE